MGRLDELTQDGKVSPEALQTILLDEIAGRLGDVYDRLGRIEEMTKMKTFRLPHIRNFPKPYQSQNVPVGERVKVWSYTIPEKYIALVDDIANDYLANFDIEWLIDGLNPEASTIRRRLAEFPKPLRIDPPHIAQREITWHYTNNSDTAREMAVLLNGRLMPKNELLSLITE